MTNLQRRLCSPHCAHFMYSRFQTLISRLQILKKSYVASDHVNKILRSLLAKWRPKVTAIEEAKDLNTLSVEDLISSLKCHEIGLNEHEPVKKPKSIALKSRGKSRRRWSLKKNLHLKILVKTLQSFRRWLCFPTDYNILLRRTRSS